MRPPACNSALKKREPDWVNKITADYLFTVWARKNKKLFYGTPNTDRDVEQICASALLTSVLSADVIALTFVLCPDSPIYPHWKNSVQQSKYF